MRRRTLALNVCETTRSHPKKQSKKTPIGKVPKNGSFLRMISHRRSMSSKFKFFFQASFRTKSLPKSFVSKIWQVVQPAASVRARHFLGGPLTLGVLNGPKRRRPFLSPSCQNSTFNKILTSIVLLRLHTIEIRQQTNKWDVPCEVVLLFRIPLRDS